jgi:hypothetical protein
MIPLSHNLDNEFRTKEGRPSELMWTRDENI